MSIPTDILEILQAVAKSKNLNLAMVIRDLLKPKCEQIRKSSWWVNLNSVDSNDWTPL